MLCPSPYRSLTDASENGTPDIIINAVDECDQYYKQRALPDKLHEIKANPNPDPNSNPNPNLNSNPNPRF